MLSQYFGVRIMLEDFTPFILPVALSAGCYFVASVIAFSGSLVPRQVYVKRLVYMVLFIVLWWSHYLPYVAHAFVGNLADGDSQWFFYRNHLGAFYGAQTIWAWLIVALINWPKVKTHETN